MSDYNVLLLMTDQQRWDAVGCYGNSVVETPNLDWLASEGAVFQHAYSSCPSCVPARASLLTGMDPWNTGILGMGQGQGPMGVGFKHTLPGELAQAQYHTQLVGKGHFFPQRSLNGFHNTILDESGRAEDPGFVSDYRRWFYANRTGEYDITDHGVDWNSWMARPYHAPEFLHPTNWTVNESIRFLKNHDPSKPFFLMTSFARPHSPYDALPYYFDLYMNKNVPSPYLGDWSHIHDVEHDAKQVDAWRGVRSEEEIKRARAGYYGSINHIDHQIGRLLMCLRSINQLNNTLVIFISDHGDMLGDHNLWRKTYAYEGSAHVPLIVRLPRDLQHKAVQNVEEVVELQDIMPTILDVLGLPIPETVDGQSTVNLLTGTKTQWRTFAHGEHCTCYSEEQEMQYVTDGRFKYIWFPRLGTEQFFHLTEDPGECHDRAGNIEYLDEVRKWKGYLISVLEKRNAGLTSGAQLICQAGKPFHVSPKYKERLEGASFKWM